MRVTGHFGLLPFPWGTCDVCKFFALASFGPFLLLSSYMWENKLILHNYKKWNATLLKNSKSFKNFSNFYFVDYFLGFIGMSLKVCT